MIPLKKNLRFKPAQKCIHCDKTDVKLSREHIVPRSLGGTWILPAASCEECRDITSKFEKSVAREMYIVLRTKNNFYTGHPENRPECFEVNIEKSDGSQERIEIHQSKYPTLYPVLHLPPPGILSGAELSDMSPAGMKLVVVGNQNEMNAFAQEYPNAKISANILMWSDFFKMLAKIAHGLTVAHCGTVGYTPLLPSLILGKYPYLSNLVGGADKSDHVIGPTKVNEPYLMKLDGYEIIFDSKGYVIVNINIMDGRCSTYTVVSGHINDWNAFMTNTSHVKQEGKKEFAHGMRTRFMFIHEWTNWIVQIIRHYVARDYPNYAKQWPLLDGYSFDAYALPPTHYLLILKNTTEKIPSGPDAAIVLPHNDHPSLPPNIADIEVWQQWCRSRLLLSNDQWPILLPVHDLGKSHNVNEERKLLTEEEQKFWVAQLNYLIKCTIFRKVDSTLKCNA